VELLRSEELGKRAFLYSVLEANRAQLLAADSTVLGGVALWPINGGSWAGAQRPGKPPPWRSTARALDWSAMPLARVPWPKRNTREPKRNTSE
jgi:hypothetical protein